ncbi:MAG: oxidoreductase [Asgard group archaeon]|nr:oxidoreductase [Asgard group archaeon]
MSQKITFAIAAGSYCGGCDMAIVALNDLLIPLEEMIDLKYWQFAADFKEKDVEKLKDNEIDICLYDGPIRTSEHAHIAHLFRKKSKFLIAYGSCACFGGIPALANTFNTETYLDETYTHGFNMDESGPNHPRPKSEYKKGRKMTLPKLLDSCLPLSSEVEVDAYIPGCPPVRSQFEKLIDILVDFQKNGNLPLKGTVIAGDKALCDECERERPEEIVIDKFVRPHEIDPDPDKCLLSQGIICMGPATRSGCGALCPNANLPCRGCFGPAPEVDDLGLKMLSAIASIAGAKDEGALGEEGLKKLMSQVADPFGTFYRFAIPKILELQKKQAEKQNQNMGEKGKE